MCVTSVESFVDAFSTASLGAMGAFLLLVPLHEHVHAFASDFSNLRQNGLVRITIPLPPNILLIDPTTNAVSDETFVDVWRMVPSVSCSRT